MIGPQWPWNVTRLLPVDVSHTMSDASPVSRLYAAAAKERPLGENAAGPESRPPFSSGCTSRPVAASKPYTMPSFLEPIYAYSHNGSGAAIVGGAFYNPTQAAFPSQYVGQYFFEDLINGTAGDPVFSFAPDPIAPDFVTLTVKVPASDGRYGGLSDAITISDGVLMRNEYVGN